LLLGLPAALALGGVSALGLGSCGSDETGSAAATGGTPTTAYCDNPADLEARDKGYCPGNKSVTQIAGKCGLDCLLEEDAGGCVTDCVHAQTDLSVECSSCVSGTVLCGRDHCLQECISDTQSELCLACRCGGNKDGYSCYVDYEACSGVHLTDCDQLEAGTWTGYPPVDGGCPDDGG